MYRDPVTHVHYMLDVVPVLLLAGLLISIGTLAARLRRRTEGAPLWAWWRLRPLPGIRPAVRRIVRGGMVFIGMQLLCMSVLDQMFGTDWLRHVLCAAGALFAVVAVAATWIYTDC